MTGGNCGTSFLTNCLVLYLIFENPGALALVRNGDQVLDALGLKGTTYAGVMKQLGVITVGNLFLACLGLLRQQPRPPTNRKKKVKGRRIVPQTQRKRGARTAAAISKSQTTLPVETVVIRKVKL